VAKALKLVKQATRPFLVETPNSVQQVEDFADAAEAARAGGIRPAWRCIFRREPALEQ
jgi:hypothetical protein